MKAIIAPIDIILRWFLIVLAVLMVLTVSWQVFSRYALRAPSSLTEELARFQLIWLGLLGAVYTFRNRMHVGIDIFVAPLTGKKYAVQYIGDAILKGIVHKPDVQDSIDSTPQLTQGN